ncbi:PTS sugar transporter subunit IIA [Neorhizobium sp. T25_13]|uniref:PTS sugar transporter subunit IIA n=1 Tax=Neorhizobium sp. T25_13 TaxID=2093830 RepID=UPI000CF947E6|nr:PTS sugar transporter subunit IIA [Neorhizobium sp. T25_13]
MIFRNLSANVVTLDLVANGKYSALRKIALNIAKSAEVDDHVVLRGLWERESGRTNGIGRGIAIPHALLEPISDPVASFTRLTVPIDFGSADGHAVDLIFTLLWPRAAAVAFLPALAQLCRLLRASRIREGLRVARSADEVIAILDGDPRAIYWPVSEQPPTYVSVR